MKHKLSHSVTLVAALSLFLAAGLSFARQSRTTSSQRSQGSDLKIVQKVGYGGQTIENTTLIKGARQRTEANTGAGMNIVNITQCDLKRTIQISETAKKYLITPMAGGDSSGGAESAPAPASSEPSRRGGIVTYTDTVTDTGERKQMFGFNARHLKTSTVVESSPDACQQAKQRIDTDGWYADFEFGLNCSEASARRMMPPLRPGCRDQIRYQHVGGARAGYPLMVTTTIYGPDGAVQSTSTSEVVELSREPLSAALFDVPAGYTETKNPQDLYNISGMMSAAMGGGAGPAPEAASATGDSGSAMTKAPGAIRIGVLPVNNKTDQDLSGPSLRESLIGKLTAAGLDAVALDGLTDIAREAAARQCDFVLYTDITSLKKASAAKKAGGLFGRAVGVGSIGVDKTEARVSFRLLPPGSNSPRLDSSKTARDEGDQASIEAALEQEAQAVAASAGKNR